MTLRPFDESRDGQALAAWQADAEAAHWLGGAEDESALAGGPQATRWIFEREGSPAGYGELVPAADGTHVRLRRVVVDPAQRRMGLGAGLVRALVEQARTRHPSLPVYARIAPENVPALLAYPAAGLVPLEPLPAGFDERWVWLEALDEAPAVPGGALDN